MFLGEYEHNLDDKGRLAIPSRFREELGEGVVVTRGFDRCLMGFPRPIWEKLAHQVSGLSLGQGEARSLRHRPGGRVPLHREREAGPAVPAAAARAERPEVRN